MKPWVIAIPLAFLIPQLPARASQPGIVMPASITFRGPSSLVEGESAVVEIIVQCGDSKYLAKSKSRAAPFILELNSDDGLDISGWPRTIHFNFGTSKRVSFFVRAKAVKNYMFHGIHGIVLYDPLFGRNKFLGSGSHSFSTQSESEQSHE